MQYSILVSLLAAVAVAQDVVVPDEDPQSNGSLVCDPSLMYSPEDPCGYVFSAASSNPSSSVAGGTVCDPAQSYPGSQSCNTSGPTPTLVYVGSSPPTAFATPTSTALSVTATSALSTPTALSVTGTTSPSVSVTLSVIGTSALLTSTASILTQTSVPSTPAVWTGTGTGAGTWTRTWTSAVSVYTSQQSSQTGTTSAVTASATFVGWSNYTPTTAIPISQYTGAASSLKLPSFGAQAAGFVGILVGLWLI